MTKTITVPASISTPPQPIVTPFGTEPVPAGAQPTVTNCTVTLTLDDAAQAIFSPAPAGALLTAAQLVAAGYTAQTLLAALTLIETAT